MTITNLAEEPTSFFSQGAACSSSMLAGQKPVKQTWRWHEGLQWRTRM